MGARSALHLGSLSTVFAGQGRLWLLVSLETGVVTASEMSAKSLGGSADLGLDHLVCSNSNADCRSGCHALYLEALDVEGQRTCGPVAALADRTCLLDILHGCHGSKDHEADRHDHDSDSGGTDGGFEDPREVDSSVADREVKYC